MVDVVGAIRFDGFRQLVVRLERGEFDMQLDGFNAPFVRDQALAAGFASVELYVQNLIDRDAERLAIQEGIDAINAGRVCDFDDFDRAFRKCNGIPANA